MVLEARAHTLSVARSPMYGRAHTLSVARSPMYARTHTLSVARSPMYARAHTLSVARSPMYYSLNHSVIRRCKIRSIKRAVEPFRHYDKCELYLMNQFVPRSEHTVSVICDVRIT
jgi:hypothetical protein